MKQTLYYIKSKYTISKSVHYQLRKIQPIAPIRTRFYSLTMNGLLVVKAGYAYDGPSGPTIDTPSTMFCALVHDVMYEMFRKEQLSLDWRGEADEELSEIGKACGANPYRMEIWEWGVDKFAEKHALPENKKIMYEVPAITIL